MRDLGEALRRRSRPRASCVARSSGASARDRRAAALGGRLADRAHDLLQHVLLQGHDHLDQAAPHLLDEGHHLVEVGIVRQLQARLLGLGDRRLRLDRARKRQIVREQFLLERHVLVLQPRDLGLERRALVRHRLAGPADRPPGAERHLPGAAVEPQVAVVGAVEGVAVVVALSRWALRARGRCRAAQGRPPARTSAPCGSSDLSLHCANHDRSAGAGACSVVAESSSEQLTAAGIAQNPNDGRAPQCTISREEPRFRAGSEPALQLNFQCSVNDLDGIARFLTRPHPLQYGPRGLGAAELPRSARPSRVSKAWPTTHASTVIAENRPPDEAALSARFKRLGERLGHHPFRPSLRQ